MYHALNWTCLATFLLQSPLYEIEKTSTSRNDYDNKNASQVPRKSVKYNSAFKQEENENEIKKIY